MSSNMQRQITRRSVMKTAFERRHRVSCTECRRRKQRCNWARDRPCNNCAKRYPPVSCVYASEECKPSCDGGVISSSLNDPDPESLKLLRRIWKSAQTCSSTMWSGTAVDDLRFLPIEPTKRNAELLHCFHHTLEQYIATIDGKDPPLAFNKMFMSRIVQSPLAANMPLHSASCYQAALRGLEVQKCTEVIILESRTMALIRAYIEKGSKVLQVDAILTVFLLIENEWHWCDDDHKVREHMKGLKEMLRLVGGVESPSIDLWIRRHIVLADYQIACCTEKDLFLVENQSDDGNLPALDQTIASLNGPLYPSNMRISEIAGFQDLSPSTLEILDDTKFLTGSLLVTQSTVASPQDFGKLEATALWTYNRVAALSSIPPSPLNSTKELLYETIRLSALLYCKAITSRTLLSQSSDPVICMSLWQTIWLVDLSQWKQIPGVFLWVLLVACTSLKAQAQRTFLNMNIWMVTLYIGLSSHEVAKASLGSFLGLQKWIKSFAESKG